MEYFKRLAHGAGKQASIISIKSRAAMDSSKIKQKLASMQTDEERLMITLGRKVCELYESGAQLDDSLVYYCQSVEKCKTQREDLQEQLSAIQKRAEKEIERANEQERQQNSKHSAMRNSIKRPPPPKPPNGATIINADKVPPTRQAEIVGTYKENDETSYETSQSADNQHAGGENESEFSYVNADTENEDTGNISEKDADEAEGLFGENEENDILDFIDYTVIGDNTDEN